MKYCVKVLFLVLAKGKLMIVFGYIYITECKVVHDALNPDDRMNDLMVLCTDKSIHKMYCKHGCKS